MGMKSDLRDGTFLADMMYSNRAHDARDYRQPVQPRCTFGLQVPYKDRGNTHQSAYLKCVISYVLQFYHVTITIKIGL